MATQQGRRAFLKKAVCLLSSQVVFGCGGGSSSGSTEATTTPPPVPPTIVNQPLDQSVLSGERATFEVIVDGTQPITFQWQRNGVDIDGATSSSYTTPVTVPGDSATYNVIVTNYVDSVISRDSILTVTARPVSVDTTSITIDSTLYTTDNTP